ncbi:MAG: NAD(P)-dependent oxidoreductase [Armatimonadota bacterium]|nr:NAD(P)-dependent oxidoreductase [Armatimonadota bacterium]
MLETVEQLDDALSEPAHYVVNALSKLEGDIIVLGAGGKMGPSLTRMIKRASDMAGSNRRVIGVSRFTSAKKEETLNDAGVKTIRCDLLDPDQMRSLPDAPNVIYMVGVKFGTSSHQAMTWAVNTYLPGAACQKFRNSRILAFSTGNIYGLVPVDGAGSLETDETNPKGEYSMSALGRERVFEHFSQALGIPVALIRLNYACEFRYGVLVDLARKVYIGEKVDLSTGYVNVMWQGDANAMTLGAFDHMSSSPFILNLAGRKKLSVRRVAERFGSLMGKSAAFTGTELPDAFLSDSRRAFGLFGYPQVDEEQMMYWVSDWVMRGGENLGRPTHFERRDGKY